MNIHIMLCESWILGQVWTTNFTQHKKVNMGSEKVYIGCTGKNTTKYMLTLAKLRAYFIQKEYFHLLMLSTAYPRIIIPARSAWARWRTLIATLPNS